MKQEEKFDVILPFVLFFIGADLFTTMQGVEHGFREANPLLAYFLQFGFWGVLAILFLQFVAIFLLQLRYHQMTFKKYPVFKNFIYYVLLFALYTRIAVTLFNTALIIKYRGW